jgi:hypothetical protein
MRNSLLAALALASAAPSSAQGAIGDLSVATPIGGNWVYSASASGSDARFMDASSREQLTIRCTRATRTVSLVKPAAAGTTNLAVWTSSSARTLPATFDAGTASATSQLPAFDAFLDAIAYSRGRFGVAVPGGVPLVLPPWAEVGRVVEDCRV